MGGQGVESQIDISTSISHTWNGNTSSRSFPLYPEGQNDYFELLARSGVLKFWHGTIFIGHFLVPENDINSQLPTPSLFILPFFPGAQMNKMHFQKTPVRQGEHICSVLWTKKWRQKVVDHVVQSNLTPEPILLTRVVL